MYRVGAEVWIRDNGTTMHTVDGGSRVYVCEPPTVENDRIVINDLKEFPVECYGNLDVISHEQEDVDINL